MILFYNKTTGDIIGKIEGRVHNEDQLKMFIGDKNEIEMLVIQWIKNRKGVYEPDNKQKDICVEIDADHRKTEKYKIDVKTKEFILKT